MMWLSCNSVVWCIAATLCRFGNAVNTGRCVALLLTAKHGYVTNLPTTGRAFHRLVSSHLRRCVARWFSRHGAKRYLPSFSHSPSALSRFLTQCFRRMRGRVCLLGYSCLCFDVLWRTSGRDENSGPAAMRHVCAGVAAAAAMRPACLNPPSQIPNINLQVRHACGRGYHTPYMHTSSHT